MTIEINEQFQRALELMENTTRNVFITGRAGTGKSTLLSYFLRITQKNVVALAPTGVAALNIGGQTIHSFFRFKPDITPSKAVQIRINEDDADLFKGLHTIIIDEVSMVRADLLDCVDAFLRKHGPQRNVPFGGLQMVFIGDLYQLAPVVSRQEKEIFHSTYDTSYFFSAAAYKKLDVETVELEKIYRQQDARFIAVLNRIRNNSVVDADLDLLNSRYLPDYKPPKNQFCICLTTTNALADRINLDELGKLKGRIHTFTALVEGEFSSDYMPTRPELKLKAGAQIMMLNNDADGRWVNGTIGTVLGIRSNKNGDEFIEARLAEGEKVEITPHAWEIFHFYVQEGRLHSDVVGKFTQFPLMLAWAVTIHKSQGKTFNRVVIDIGKGTFAHGQMYVALSRRVSLEGIILKQPVTRKNVWIDYKVLKFMTGSQYERAERDNPLEHKLEMIRQAIKFKRALRIIYLKPSDEKSTRIVEPRTIGEMEYNGVPFTGMRAFCLSRHEERTFRVDRILQIEVM